MHMRLSQNPVLAIVAMVMRLLAKMTVLVPVPDGSINAKEHANVAGIISKRG